MKHSVTPTLVLALATAMTATPSEAQDACRHSSQQMRSACGAEASDDLFTGLAICANLADPDESRECAIEARSEFREILSTCRDQREARLDLCDALADSGPYDPEIDPDNFLSPDEVQDAPHPYFPLIFGHTWVYEAEDETIIVTVLDETREIAGVEVFSVQDVVMEEDEIVEDTIDWYAQDMAGNVWYFGEISRNFEDGFLVDVEGSFLAGEDGAKAGIIMQAQPTVGLTYRQEFALGEAEDAGEILDTAADESVPAAECNGACLVVRDFTPLEPDANEEKYFAPGIGLILEVDLEEDDARAELVEFLPGN